MRITLQLPLWFVGDQKVNPICMLNASGPDFIPLFRSRELALEFLQKSKDSTLMTHRITTVTLLLNFVDNMIVVRNQTHIGLDPRDGMCEIVEDLKVFRDALDPRKGTHE